MSYGFYLPIALFVDVQTFVMVHAAYQVYQFFVHTRLVKRLGPLEWLLATPSHHRVHHGSDPHLIDRNYGGFFIVFDRLLGTFTPETHEPTYGIPGGYDVSRPLFSNTYAFVRMFRATASLGSTRAKLRLWFGPPEQSRELLSFAAKTSSPNVRPSLGATFGPLLIGLTGTCIVVYGGRALPWGIVVLVGLISLVAVEWACRSLDRRS